MVTYLQQRQHGRTVQKKTVFMINGNGSVEWGNFRPFPWLTDFNPPCIFPPLSNRFLSSLQDRASAQQQLWMVEDTLAGLGGPQKPPSNTEPDSPSPALQGEESSEREVRPHTSLPPPVSCPICPWPNPLPTHLFNPWSANQPQVHILYFLVWYYGHSPDVCLTHNTTTWWVANTSQGPVACISTPHSVMTRR